MRATRLPAAVLLAPALVAGALQAAEADAPKPAATKKQPANTLTEKEKAEGFALLFDGKSLAGWKVSENPKSFKVVDGRIVTAGPRAHAFYAGPVAGGVFRDFEFRAKVRVQPKSNSGIYIHAKYRQKGWPLDQGYECQVCSDTYRDPRKTGSIYKRKDLKKSPVKDGEWFDYRIVVKGRKITTIINGKRAAEYVEPEDPKRRRLKGGTFALQCHDPRSTVEYHTIRVRVLPAADPSKTNVLVSANAADQIETSSKPEWIGEPEGGMPNQAWMEPFLKTEFDRLAWACKIAYCSHPAGEPRSQKIISSGRISDGADIRQALLVEFGQWYRTEGKRIESDWRAGKVQPQDERYLPLVKTVLWDSLIHRRRGLTQDGKKKLSYFRFRPVPAPEDETERLYQCSLASHAAADSA